MSVLVLHDAQVKSDDVSAMKTYLAEIVPDTRVYDGCQGIDVYFNTEDAGNMVMVEHWDSRTHHEKYLAWRTETGAFDRLAAMLAGAPNIRYLERIDA